jgi:hypothetical protein
MRRPPGLAPGWQIISPMKKGDFGMTDRRMGPDQNGPISRARTNGKDLDAGPDLLDLLGGERLEGSGFEGEIPEPGFEWRDPR